MASSEQSATPQKLLKSLEQLRDGLQTALGDRLISLILYGDAARLGDFDPQFSDVSVLQVLSDVSVDTLKLARPSLVRARQQLRLSVMTLTEDDLRRSCDVFPIRFVDMQEHHRLMCGRDVLSSLSIADDHLRLRCEQELKNLMIRQRMVYLRFAEQPEALGKSMAESIGAALRLISVALTLKTGLTPDDHEAVMAAGQEEFGLKTNVLRTILTARKEHRLLTDVRTFDEYMNVIHDAATAVDRLTVCSD